MNRSSRAWYDGPSAPVKPVHIVSWTVGPPDAAADDAADEAGEGAPAVDDAAPAVDEAAPAVVAADAAELELGVAEELFFELELQPDNATTPASSTVEVVTSVFFIPGDLRQGCDARPVQFADLGESVTRTMASYTSL